jgi:hypothetical protein
VSPVLRFQADAEHDTAYRRYLLTLPRGQRRESKDLCEMEFRYVNPYSDKGEGFQKPLPL